MHVLFVVENCSVPRDRRVWAEAQAVRDFGHTVSVICPSDPSQGIAKQKAKDRFPDPSGIKIYYHPRGVEGKTKIGFLREYFSALFWEFVLSLRVFLKCPFQVIHAANPPDHLFLIAAVYKLFGVKYVYDHHDLSPENYVAQFNKKDFLYKALLWMEQCSFWTADIVISTNESYKKIALERGGKSDKQVFIVRNGPYVTELSGAKPNQRLRDGFKYLVGYVGVIGKQENIENLLSAAEHIVKVNKRNDIRFIIVGTGTHLKTLVNMSHDMGLDPYVKFTGYIPDEELKEILATVDICVNPESRNDFTDKSTMIKIMEYMAFGRPIVQFHTTEGEVTAGQSAYYVREQSNAAFAEAILKLLTQEDERNKMGNIGRKRIENSLSWERQKCELMRAYTTLCPKGR